MPTFDTLTFAKRLQAAGVPPQQAEAHATALKELAEDNLATKHDLKELEMALRSDLKELEMRMDARFADVDGRFRLLYWMVGFNLTLTLLTLSLTTGILLKLLAG